MPPIKLSDSSGSTMSLLDIDGYLIPPFPVENLEEEFRSIRRRNAHNDDILISAYPKAGTHWIWEIVNMLIRQTTTLSSLNKEFVMMEATSQDDYDRIESPRVLNTHIYANHLPEEFFKKKCKIVYILRNPKDIALSFYHHHSKLLPYDYEGKWEDYLKRFVEGKVRWDISKVDFGSWFDYTKHWQQFIDENPDYPIHIIHYEDMKQNGIGETEKLGEFLDLKLTRSFYKDVYDSCQFDKMKTEKNKNKDLVEWRDNQPGMYRKGKVGDWKNWFTVAQNEFFDSVYEKEMANSDLRFKYDIS